MFLVTESYKEMIKILYLYRSSEILYSNFHLDF